MARGKVRYNSSKIYKFGKFLSIQGCGTENVNDMAIPAYGNVPVDEDITLNFNNILDRISVISENTKSCWKGDDADAMRSVLMKRVNNLRQFSEFFKIMASISTNGAIRYDKSEKDLEDENEKVAFRSETPLTGETPVDMTPIIVDKGGVVNE